MMEGTRLPELDEEIRLAKTRKAELLERIPSGEANRAWEKLTTAYDLMFSDPEKKEAHLETILRVLSKRRHDYFVWADIDKQTEQIRRLSESQNRIMVNREITYTAEDMLLMLTTVAGSVRRRVSDQNEVKAVGRDMDAIALRDFSGVIESER